MCIVNAKLNVSAFQKMQVDQEEQQKTEEQQQAQPENKAEAEEMEVTQTLISQGIPLEIDENMQCVSVSAAFVTALEAQLGCEYIGGR